MPPPPRTRLRRRWLQPPPRTGARRTPHFDALARRFRGHASLVLAKMDGSANEVAGLDYDGYPTLVLYKPEASAERVVASAIFVGDEVEHTADGLAAFLRAQGLEPSKEKEEL